MYYISHKISGETPEIQHQNCRDAVEFAKSLHMSFPNREFYVPAESEPFVEKAIAKGWLSVEQVLTLDCEIIHNDCEGVIFFMPKELSTGMYVELTHCQKNNIPFIIVKDVCVTGIHEFMLQTEKKD